MAAPIIARCCTGWADKKCRGALTKTREQKALGEFLSSIYWPHFVRRREPKALGECLSSVYWPHVVRRRERKALGEFLSSIYWPHSVRRRERRTPPASFCPVSIGRF